MRNSEFSREKPVLFLTLTIFLFTNPSNKEELVSPAQLPDCIFFKSGFKSARNASRKYERPHNKLFKQLMRPALFETATDKPLLKSAISLFSASNSAAAILSYSSALAISRACFCLAFASAFTKACLASSSARFLSYLTCRDVKVLLDVVLTLSAT